MVILLSLISTLLSLLCTGIFASNPNRESEISNSYATATPYQQVSRILAANWSSIDPRWPIPSLSDHRSFVEASSILQNLSRKCSEIFALESIGKSVLGRDLWVLTISDHPRDFELGEPSVKIIGNMHGDESLSFEAVLALAQFLCDAHRQHIPEIEALISTIRIVLMVSMNPDGHEASYSVYQRTQPGIHMENHMFGYSLTRVGRANANGVDLNRDFPSRFRGRSRPGPRQPETSAMITWMSEPRNHFVLSANLHGGALVANYPFDDSEAPNTRETVFTPAPDHEVFLELAQNYADTHPRMSKGIVPQECLNSRAKFSRGTTNGAAWYSVVGGMQDWNYMVHGTMEITIEMSCLKWPLPAHKQSLGQRGLTSSRMTELDALWKENLGPMLQFIANVHATPGVKGLILDVDSGALIENATLKFKLQNSNPGAPELPTIRTTTHGEYWRLLEPLKTYEVTVTAQHYYPSVRSIQTTDRGQIIRHFQLRKSPELNPTDRVKLVPKIEAPAVQPTNQVPTDIGTPIFDDYHRRVVDLRYPRHLFWHSFHNGLGL